MTYTGSTMQDRRIVGRRHVAAHLAPLDVRDDRDAGYYVLTVERQLRSGRVVRDEEWLPVSIGATCDVIYGTRIA
jgi:hypothetical protein